MISGYKPAKCITAFRLRAHYECYQSAFYRPLVSGCSNFGQWTENGAVTATQRANGIWKNPHRV
ncbi:MAG: hypothetical protein GY820_19410 [Gammaproteobacteria bacterium]|nr:hypothetical protein [Gammaproteobacteria bacterium]